MDVVDSPKIGYMKGALLKPHIRPFGRDWLCRSAWYTGIGETPEIAFRNWARGYQLPEHKFPFNMWAAKKW